jgi:hypothetical protein
MRGWPIPKTGGSNVNYLNGETANELSIDRLNIVHGGKGDGTGGGDGKGTGPGTGGGDGLGWLRNAVSAVESFVKAIF